MSVARSRWEAKQLGLNKYFTGKPCPHGHNVERYTINGVCVQCHIGKATKWKANNPERAKEIMDAANKRYQIERNQTRSELAGRSKPDRCENCCSREKIFWHHNHKTGQFEAWLCHSCNVIEGHAHGRPEVLEGIAHLMRTGQPINVLPGYGGLKTLVAHAQNWHGELIC